MNLGGSRSTSYIVTWPFDVLCSVSRVPTSAAKEVRQYRNAFMLIGIWVPRQPRRPSAVICSAPLYSLLQKFWKIVTRKVAALLADWDGTSATSLLKEFGYRECCRTPPSS